MNDFYENIELTPEELRAAVYEAKKRKYFHEKNKLYWESKEVNKKIRPVLIDSKQFITKPA